MKYTRITSVILSAALLCAFCGCSQEPSAPAETTPEASQSASETAAPETTASETAETSSADEKVTEKVTEKAPEKEETDRFKTIAEFPMEVLTGTFLDGGDAEKELLGADTLTGIFTQKDLDAENSVLLPMYNRIRSSTLTLGDSAKKAMDTAQLAFNFETPYNIEFEGMKLDLELTDNIDVLNVVKVSESYRIKGELSLRGFMRRNSDGTADFIIDPAYMRGIPVCSVDPDEILFDINGEKVYMDTYAVKLSDETDGGLSEALTEGVFSYVEATLPGMSCAYSSTGGYDCSAALTDVKVINSDTSDAIANCQLDLGADGKDPEIKRLYNAMMNNIDKLGAEDTYGIVLLDLDFDEAPELLITRYTPQEFEEGVYIQPLGGMAETDIYRIDGEELRYIDTLEVRSREVYDISAYFGLKTLSDGTKSWYVSSGADLLVNLDGDKLRRTDVFSWTGTPDPEDPSKMIDSYKYYGEEMVPVVTPVTDPELLNYGIYNTYEWNGITSNFGEWELYGFARADFCKDIEKSYLLYSDWLVDLDTAQKKELSERDFAYNIAYLADSYCLGGDNNPALREHSYWFLGAYAKPVIYLYPEEETNVSVSIDFANGGAVTCSYPEYNGGWNVTAMPDGTLFDENGNEYYCLYWEGEGAAMLDRSKGWCVAAEDTAEFLREKLTEIGLTAREANEFIIYWLPVMQKNRYNVVTFHTEDYAAAVKLNVSPAPDTVIRVFMTFAGSSEAVGIPPQELPHFEREGFTLAEWGGQEVELSAESAQ